MHSDNNKTFIPKEVILCLTSSCNLTCPHCFTNKAPAVLCEEEALNFLNKIKKSPLTSSISSIGFSGGEPFLQVPLLCNIVKHACNQEFTFTRIMTNGACFTNQEELKETLTKLQEAGYDGKICVSIDSFHNTNPAQLLTFMQEVIKKFGGYSLEVQSVVESKKVKEDKKLFRKIAKLLSASFIDATSIFNKTGAFFLESDNLYLPIYRTARSYPALDSASWQAKRWFREDHCLGMGNIFFVLPSGKVAPCCGFSNENPALCIGDITDSIEKIMQNASNNRLISLCFEGGLKKEVAKYIKESKKNKNWILGNKTADKCAACFIATNLLDN